jgi:hypothetical protein
MISPNKSFALFIGDVMLPQKIALENDEQTALARRIAVHQRGGRRALHNTHWADGASRSSETCLHKPISATMKELVAEVIGDGDMFD